MGSLNSTRIITTLELILKETNRIVPYILSSQPNLCNYLRCRTLWNTVSFDTLRYPIQIIEFNKMQSLIIVLDL